ncbi:MAG: polymerase subunit delta [Solirubrobacteraceae bacterium]|nr:polymerase subunit delta [Solirubrobacteraceae bacterium]
MTAVEATLTAVSPAFKSAYLIHGDDHGRIAERRARLRTMAETQSGSSGVEVFENEACTPEVVVAALSAMTFAMGRRFVIADGVERWKEADVGPVAAALKRIDPESLTVTFLGREEGRVKVPAALVKAVQAVGGVVAEEHAVKARDLPGWAVARAGEVGLQVDVQAARALIARVGDRQQRLLRELEKISLELGRGAAPSAEEIDELCAGSAERKAWTLADAVVAGDREVAMRLLMELRGQGERVPSLMFQIVRRLRDAHEIAVGLDAGESPGQIKGRLRMPPFAADQLIADVRRRDAETFRRALGLLADLEAESRGLSGASLDEETTAVRIVAEIATA